MLDDTEDADDTDDTERNHGELLGELVHAKLQWRPFLLDLLHHSKDHSELSLCPGGNNDTRPAT